MDIMSINGDGSRAPKGRQSLRKTTTLENKNYGKEKMCRVKRVRNMGVMELIVLNRVIRAG